VSTQGPPAPQQPRWRRFWSERSWKGKTAIVVGIVLLVLIVIGIAVPAPDDSEKTSAEATSPTTTSAPATTSEAATTQEAADTTDEDTGRMSDGEFQQFSNALTEVDQEIQQFATTLRKCAVLFQAFELADGSKCMDEGYSGFEDKASLALFTANDLKDDVAKDCLDATRTYTMAINRFANYLSAFHAAGANLQVANFRRLSKKARTETIRYRTLRELAERACSPQ
jgi:hypothetical protein